MRLSSQTTWPALATVLLARGAKGESNQMIIFDDGPFIAEIGQTPSIAITPVSRLEALRATRQTKNFTWWSKGEIVTEVVLFVNGSMELTAKSFDDELASTTTTTTTTAMQTTMPKVGGIPRQSVPGEMMKLYPKIENDTSNSGVITFEPWYLIDLAQRINNAPMYFEAIWGSGKGSSYSRQFTMGQDSQIDSIWPSLTAKFTNSTPVRSEVGMPASSTAGVAGQLPSAATATAVSDESSGGLSTGAIAGIAVACGVVGLALVGGLVWFLCRRRRQDGMAPYGEVRNRTQELMAEKEANTGVDVSPHSPYSDDGAIGHQANGGGHHPRDSFLATGAMGASAVTAGNEFLHHPQPVGGNDRSYTPYSDRPTGSVGSPSTQRISLVPQQAESLPPSEHDTESHHAPAPGMRSATAASQYAHLVEEGMTADDIRRIEEEERQLDAAIEQAGVRR